MNKKFIKPYTKENNEQAELGKVILECPDSAFVSYGNKKWAVADLLEHLAQQVNNLGKETCVPCAACLFKYYKYVDIQSAASIKKAKKSRND